MFITVLVTLAVSEMHLQSTFLVKLKKKQRLVGVISEIPEKFVIGIKNIGWVSD